MHQITFCLDICCFPKIMTVELRHLTINIYTSMSYDHTPPPQHPPVKDFLSDCVCLGRSLPFPERRVCVCACACMLVCVCSVNALQHFAVFSQLKLLLTEQRRSFIQLHALIILFTHSIVHGSSMLHAHTPTLAQLMCAHTLKVPVFP